jgi:hypothetical protein
MSKTIDTELFRRVGMSDDFILDLQRIAGDAPWPETKRKLCPEFFEAIKSLWPERDDIPWDNLYPLLLRHFQRDVAELTMPQMACLLQDIIARENPHAGTEPKRLTVAEIAQRYFVDESTVRRWAEAGDLSGADRSTGPWLIPEASLPAKWKPRTSPPAKGATPRRAKFSWRYCKTCDATFKATNGNTCPNGHTDTEPHTPPPGLKPPPKRH